MRHVLTIDNLFQAGCCKANAASAAVYGPDVVLTEYGKEMCRCPDLFCVIVDS